MAFKMEFKLGNEYFVSGGDDAVADILEDVAYEIRRGYKDHGNILDGNGNVVGTWEYEREDMDEPNEDDSAWNDIFYDDDEEETPIRCVWSMFEQEWIPYNETYWDGKKGDYFQI